jgi:hypothetical protein
MNTGEKPPIRVITTADTVWSEAFGPSTSKTDWRLSL